MSNPSQRDLERAELQAVLNSGIFSKASNLAKMLQYIGEKYLDGQEDFLKEYNIGVEALGRSADFDPKQDSIVRVEARRLREKLKRYYETDGAGHPIVVKLEVGHYIPEFVHRSATSVEGVASQAQVTPENAGNLQNGWPMRQIAVLVLASLLLVAMSVAAIIVMKSRSSAANVVSRPALGVNAAPSVGDRDLVRILAGYSRKEYVDSLGNAWGPDRYFSGGEAHPLGNASIARAADPALFGYSRMGEFSYDIPLKAEPHELHLYFVETDYGPGTLRGGGETSRLFHIDLNGNRLLTDFDVVSDAGGNFTADERVYKDVYPARDGYLHLKFLKAIDYPQISALEIIPSPPGKMLPLRIVAQERSYTDESGNLWRSDVYAAGGRLISNNRPMAATRDPGLYAGERYGHFDYAIPVAEGRYGLTLYFAETYFGPSNPGKGGAGSRAFDIYCNGENLLRNFDVVKEAGGENRALQKTFHNLRPNALGKLALSFVPVKNYASVKAIEVEDESRY